MRSLPAVSAGCMRKGGYCTQRPGRPARSLRINIGNVYYEQGKHPPAIKAWRMALDTLPPAAGPQRARLLRNIGLAFVRMGQYADAAGAYEAALTAEPEHLVRGGTGLRMHPGGRGGPSASACSVCWPASCKSAGIGATAARSSFRRKASLEKRSLPPAAAGRLHDCAGSVPSAAVLLCTG